MQHRTRWVTIAIIIVVIALTAAGFTIAYLLRESQPSGSTYTKEGNGQDKITQLVTQKYTSSKGVEIEIDNWSNSRQVTSPLTISGRVPGSWSFEGSFPIDIVYEDDIGLPGTTATLKGDWMTEALVPFTATLTFDEKQLAGRDIMIVLHNANPSGAPENDDSLGLKVHVAE